MEEDTGPVSVEWIVDGGHALDPAGAARVDWLGRAQRERLGIDPVSRSLSATIPTTARPWLIE